MTDRLAFAARLASKKQQRVDPPCRPSSAISSDHLMSSPAALDALEQRLRPLEYLLGRPSAAGPEAALLGGTSVRARLVELKLALDDATRGSSPLERFVADCQCRFDLATDTLELVVRSRPSAQGIA